MHNKEPMRKEVVRFYPTVEEGLTLKQVEERYDDGLVNYDTSVKTKSMKRIIRDNVFTLFNLLNFFLGIMVLVVGSYKNLLFLGVVICNIAISTFQEIRSKKIVDKLSIISSSKVKVIRGGERKEILMDEIVLDDVIELLPGDQVITDGIILSGECEVNESFITGESENEYRKVGDTILSGSFVVSGKCYICVEHIGLENYTATISKGAKYVKKVNSELMNSLNKIVKILSFVIIPMGTLLFLRQMSIPDNTFANAVISTVAALIGMIPEGLILLTSMVLAVSVIRLSKYNVLVQELYCIETLARVDTICLDKTGTITEGSMLLHDVIPCEHNKIKEVDIALSALTQSLTDENATIEAIRQAYITHANAWQVVKTIPFDSKKKWSSATFQDHGTYVLGAPEYVFKKGNKEVESLIHTYACENRLLVLAHSNHEILDKNLPDDLKPCAMLLIRDKIRKEAKDTLAYFKKQGVALKVISGDNVETVGNIAKEVGIDVIGKMIDATTLKTKEALLDATSKYTVFGRVTPEQKKEIVLALKKNGHTVAMTGDGINDVLALKEADCSIAMASGSDAARNVSQLVLLDSNFDAMPMVVYEGRRTINNIERSATLFLVKTIYTTLLAFIFLFLTVPYPFIPIQMTLTSVATIGIPSFILALEPNKERVRGNFLTNVIGKSFPSALTIVINVLAITILSSFLEIAPEQISMLCVILTAYVGFVLLYHLCKPWNWMRRSLFLGMITLFILCSILLHTLFSFSFPTPYVFILMLAFMVIDVSIFELLTKLFHNVLHKYKVYLEKKNVSYDR